MASVAPARLAASDPFVVVADAVPTMLWMSAPDGACTFVNKAWLEFTGVPLARQLGLGWTTCVHPDDRPSVFELYLTAVESREAFKVEYRLRRADGVYCWVFDRGVPRFDAAGEFAGFIRSCMDISARKAIEVALRESEAQLRLLAARMNSAREAERAHVARELHDELGQTLTGLKFEFTRTIRDLMKLTSKPEMIDRIQSIVGGIEVATEMVRDLATSLRPPALDHLGLAAAIELEAAGLSRRTGVRCRMNGTLRNADLTPEQTIAVFRIVQEALTNVVRHADASAVRILLRQTPRATSVKIQDNGRGISETALRDRSSIGLLGMRERADLVGARLSISAAPGKGTTVLITVPVTSERRAGDDPNPAG
jgi:PAS domain S-box-containing protein